MNMTLSKHDTPTKPNDNELIDDMPESRNTLVSNQKNSRNICTIPIEQDMRKSCVTINHSIPFSSASSPPRCSLHPNSLQHTIRSSWFQQTLPTNQILLHERPRRVPPRKPSAIERAFLHALHLPIILLLLFSLTSIKTVHENRSPESYTTLEDASWSTFWPGCKGISAQTIRCASHGAWETHWTWWGT